MFKHCTRFTNYHNIHHCKDIFFVSSYLLNINLQKRFIADADVLKSLRSTQTHVVSRVSKYESNIKKVLVMIVDKKYVEVKKFVNDNNIDINSHDIWENTPLTDAASKGDVKSIKFLINDLGANPHASYDCPYNKTALHYASENGHYDAVKVLLENGANPNILDSRHYTSLDVAKSKEIVKLLESKSGITGHKIPVQTGQRLNLPKADCVHKLK
jgi:ankyrin repeat protein